MLVEFTDAESRWLRSIKEMVVAVPEDSGQVRGPLALGHPGLHLLGLRIELLLSIWLC